MPFFSGQDSSCSPFYSAVHVCAFGCLNQFDINNSFSLCWYLPLPLPPPCSFLVFRGVPISTILFPSNVQGSSIQEDFSSIISWFIEDSFCFPHWGGLVITPSLFSGLPFPIKAAQHLPYGRHTHTSFSRERVVTFRREIMGHPSPAKKMCQPPSSTLYLHSALKSQNFLYYRTHICFINETLKMLVPPGF